MHMPRPKAKKVVIAPIQLNSKVTNHSMRATGITAYLKNGGSLEIAQQLAGHASPVTTKVYDRRSDEVSAAEVERIRFE